MLQKTWMHLHSLANYCWSTAVRYELNC